MTLLSRDSSRGDQPSEATRRATPYLLYVGLALFLMLVWITYRAVRDEQRRAVARSRAEAVLALVQGSVPSRPTDVPGVTAWLHLELTRYGQSLGDAAKAELYDQIIEHREGVAVPPLFAPVRQLLAAMVAPTATVAEASLAVVPRQQLDPHAAEDAPGSFRAQSFLAAADHWLVLTRRKTLEVPIDDRSSASNRFLHRGAPRLLALADQHRVWLEAQPLPAFPATTPPRIVRFYALSEDGSLLSLPIAVAADEDARRQAAREEGRELRKQPRLPNFVANEFYFRFDYQAPARGTADAFYSGLYLDLGGQGLIATLTVPFYEPESGLRGVLGADITFDIDWQDFAHQISAPLESQVAELEAPSEKAGRQLWGELASALSTTPETALRSAVDELAERQRRQRSLTRAAPVQHGVVEGLGAVAAFQVARARWLVVLFPHLASRFPWPAVLLLAMTLLLILLGLERNRRRTETAQLKAERELQEKESLLNTMRVPLAVVDPNSDEVVHSNEAAAELGIVPGSCIGDLVIDDEAARDHYLRMQVAGPRPRRAYGVPLNVRRADGGREIRHAIVRSVSVVAPIDSLRADQRHRLGILFLLEPEVDLKLYTDELENTVRRGERQQLSGVLSHGLDILAQVLSQRLRLRSGADDDELTVWLADYLDRRIRVASWLLAHWDAEAPLTPNCSVGVEQARATIERLEAVFALVRCHDELRSQLRWTNSVLSAEPASGSAVLAVELDWPQACFLTCPIRGGFGLFVGEVLINAIKHGCPGTVPTFHGRLDRARQELRFTVENELRDEDAARRLTSLGQPYGGRRLLERLAKLYGWRQLIFEQLEGTFRVSWLAPASELGAPGESD